MTADLMRDLETFRDARGWLRHHTERNLAVALSVEASELLACYLWDGDFAPKKVTPDRVERELADVLIFALNMCLALGCDPETIIRRKMAENARKYPA